MKVDYQRILKELLNAGETLVVPDAYDAMSARIIQAAGFKAVQCSGYSISLTRAYGDERFVTLDENISRTREIASAVGLPVMADGEDGYGQGGVFRQNVKRFMRTGIAGINIEDQNLWDGSRPDKVMPAAVLTEKVKSVLSLKMELGMPDFLLNARTDALRATEDRGAALKNAIERANLYLQAGADMAFVSYVRTKQEIRLLKKEVHGPLSVAAGLPYNIEEFTVNDCREIGVARVSLPSVLILASLKALVSTMERIAGSGAFDAVRDGQIDQGMLSRLLRD